MTTKIVSAVAEKVLEVWAAPADAAEDGPVLAHVLGSTALISCLDRDAGMRALLRQIVSSIGAERAYVLELSRDAAVDPEILRVIVSTDIDGDDVPQVERKAPRALVKRSATERQPVCQSLSTSADDERTSSFLVLPATAAGRCPAVVVFENRFQDLRVERSTLQTAAIFCRALGACLEMDRLGRENDSLWQDLTQLRSAAPHEVRVPSLPPARRAAARNGRNDLKGDYSVIVGSSSRMLEVLQIIDRIAGSNAPVLINGESGTGKELVAVAIHHNSPRRGLTFVSENCAAITETLLESELFGYAKGAFTGAAKDHKGLFELAEGGTLFLDEVGDMSPSMQKKLLRVLQEGIVRRVGAKDFISVNVRIISATNKDLLEECRAGNFREDLYYRLNVINVKLPPLRERREDIPDLIDFFLRQTAPLGETTKAIEQAAIDLLMQHDWPGNIRELQNEIKKLVALSEGDAIRSRDLSEHLRAPTIRDAPLDALRHGFANLSLKDASEQLERQLIRASLDDHGGNKSLVAKALKIPKTSLYNKINKYRL